MVFLPSDAALSDRCQQAFERIAQAEGCGVVGWRRVAVNPGPLGELAQATQPEVRQILLARRDIPRAAFERKLYVIRRLVEKEVAAFAEDASRFCVASLSSRTVVYKGMLTATQLPQFYPDLRDERFESAFGIVHQRYSTNTFPMWRLAQPFRILAHNGEINTLRGNITRMRAREALIASELFGPDLEKIKPVILEGGSDSAMLDNVAELLLMSGRSLPHVMMMLVPEAWGAKFLMSEDKRAFYEYHSAVMEPWDGPAALVFTDGSNIGATLDRNGLRPARYTVTRDGLVVLASETGVLDIPGDRILSRGRLQPGKMFLVDLSRASHHPRQRDQGQGLAAAPVPALGQGAAHRAARTAGALAGAAGGAGGPPPQAASLRVHRRRPEDDHRADGRARTGGRRLDGQRRGARGALAPAATALRVLQAALRPGDQPAD